MDQPVSQDSGVRGWIELCAAAAVKPGTSLRIETDAEIYAIFNVGGEFFVTQDQCTHGPGSLSEGLVFGREIECPFHQGRFDIRTGCATLAPCTDPIRTWSPYIIDGRIYIDPAEVREPGGEATGG